MDTVEFKAKSSEVHGGIYDYKETVFVNWKTKVKIYCKEHEQHFVQPVRTHLIGQTGCKQCSTIKRRKARAKTKQKFIEECVEIHGDNFDYSETEYLNTNSKVQIRCKKHNKYFVQTPMSHLAGFTGCQYCTTEKTRSMYAYTIDEFIKLAEVNHNINNFDFSEVDYISSHIKIKIRCRIHDEAFNITPNSFHRGTNGCRQCFSESSKFNRLESLNHTEKQSPCNFYHLRFVKMDGTAFEKIGITKRGINERFNSKYFKDENIQIDTLGIKQTTLEDALVIESEILDILKNDNQLYRVHDFKNTNVGGWTECFREGAIDLTDYFRQ